MLREGGQDLREYLITTAARLIAERGAAGLAVRDIARAAKVADGVLYNYFEDKEDLLAHALIVHVGTVMHDMPPMPPPGSGTVAGNVESFIDGGLATLARVIPAFAGLVAQPNVLTRFHAMAGGHPAFGTAHRPGEPGEAGEVQAGLPGQEEDGEPRGLPALLTAYLRAEQRLGRVGAAPDVEAATKLIVGAIHGQILPAVLLNPSGELPAAPPGLARRLAATVLAGIAPRQDAL